MQTMAGDPAYTFKADRTRVPRTRATVKALGFVPLIGSAMSSTVAAITGTGTPPDPISVGIQIADRILDIMSITEPHKADRPESIGKRN